MDMKNLLTAATLSFGIIAFASTAQANHQGTPNGKHPDGNGGAVCHGLRICTTLASACKGTYTEYTDPQGGTFGKCTKVKLAPPKLTSK